MIDRRNRKRVCRLTAFAGIIIFVILHFSEHEENLNRSKEIFHKLVQNSVKTEIKNNNNENVQQQQPEQDKPVVEVPPTPHPQPQADFKPPEHEIEVEDKNNNNEIRNADELNENSIKDEKSTSSLSPSYPDIYNDEIIKIRQVTSSINFDGKVYRSMKKLFFSFSTSNLLLHFNFSNFCFV